MEYLRYEEHPELRSPVMIVAFEGWNDASEVATWSARFLVKQWSATRFVDIDPEEFYVFTETRPQVKIGENTKRVIQWPANEFYYHRAEQGEHDFIILAGIEPNLRWRTFSDAVLEVAKEMQVEVVLLLGGLLAAVPHTQAVRLTGTATDPDLLSRLQDLGVNTSRYEGPTGIVGVVSAGLSGASIPTASLWGNVPHYLSARPNVKVSLAMLRQLDRVLHLNMDLRRVERQALQFDAQVNEAVAGNQEIASYVHKLEEEVGRAGEEEPQPVEDLPSGEALVRDLEEYLRRRRQDEGENKP